MFKGHRFPKAVIIQAVHFKLRFSLSYRDVEELLSIRGLMVECAMNFLLMNNSREVLCKKGRPLVTGLQEQVSNQCVRL
jgi:hypothetical protein